MAECHQQHPNHQRHLPALNRVLGQVEGIKKMITAGRYCPDIMVQLRASQAALKAVETKLLQSHLEHCVYTSFQADNECDKNKKIAELIAIFKKID